MSMKHYIRKIDELETKLRELEKEKQQRESASEEMKALVTEQIISGSAACAARLRNETMLAVAHMLKEAVEHIDYGKIARKIQEEDR